MRLPWVARPHGYSGDDVRDIMLEFVKKRFGQQLPATPLQWLSDNSSTYTATMKRDYIIHISKPDRRRRCATWPLPSSITTNSIRIAL